MDVMDFYIMMDRDGRPSVPSRPPVASEQTQISTLILPFAMTSPTRGTGWLAQPATISHRSGMASEVAQFPTYTRDTLLHHGLS